MGDLIQQENLGPHGTCRVMRYRITYADAPAAPATVTFSFPSLPAGTILRSLHSKVSTAFDSGTSDGLLIGTAADPDRFATNTDLQSAADSAPGSGTDAPPFQLEADTVILLSYAQAGAAPTEGQADITIGYELCNV